jgi:hypothetical protein
MCHDHLTHHRAWDDGVERETDDDREANDELEEPFDGDEAPIPPLQADDDLDVLTDGGDA